MGGGGTASPAFEFCSNQSVSYTQRIDNPDGWNWCLVPDGGFDAVFFAGMAITVMCMASPRWDALISLLAGGVYEILVYYFNLGHVSNAVNLWLGMRPADIFVFVFLPPFLLDLAVRIDFFKLKKMIVNVLFMAFVMVISTCLLLVPFMLYGLDLAASGWTATYVALFGAAIASTDAAAVCAVLNAGGAPEVLSVLLEGESLFNDASSLTLFEIFKELVQESSAESLSEEIAHIVVKTITSALIGVAVGMAIGIFNRLLFIWLQWRNMPSFAEVAFSVAGAYLSFYITQVWCHGSGCVGAVAYGLYGSATLLWGISSKTRQSQQFQHFWAVLTFIVNALIFYYVGASCVNFTIRASNNLYTEGGSAELLRVALYKLPIIWAFVFVLRFAFMLPTFYGLRLLKVGGEASWQQVLFLSVGGLRGSLSLVLAQTIATLTKTSAQSSEEERREDLRSLMLNLV
ncbi:Sodium/hydrogen exchanger family-domain-containing protein [Haematococcus lacustris]